MLPQRSARALRAAWALAHRSAAQAASSHAAPHAAAAGGRPSAPFSSKPSERTRWEWMASQVRPRRGAAQHGAAQRFLTAPASATRRGPHLPANTTHPFPCHARVQGHVINPCNSHLHPAAEAGISPEGDERGVQVRSAALCSLLAACSQPPAKQLPVHSHLPKLAVAQSAADACRCAAPARCCHSSQLGRRTVSC